jgi:hypothetical protein
MSAFAVSLEDQPGELARLCEAMAGSGVNLLLCATTYSGSAVVAFIADDEAAAQDVLEATGLEYLMRPALTIRRSSGRSPTPVSTWTCSCRCVSPMSCSSP